MTGRRPLIDEAELAEIGRELDEMEALLRQPRPKPSKLGRNLHDGLRPKPTAFARAVAEGLDPIAAVFRAGYRAPNRMTVWRLMRQPRVLAEIDRLKKQKDTDYGNA